MWTNGKVSDNLSYQIQYDRRFTRQWENKVCDVTTLRTNPLIQDIEQPKIIATVDLMPPWSWSVPNKDTKLPDGLTKKRTHLWTETICHGWISVIKNIITFFEGFKQVWASIDLAIPHFLVAVFCRSPNWLVCENSSYI